MGLVDWFRPPRVVFTLFVALMGACAMALTWLGWQVLVQDRVVEAQRRQERVESAADRAVATMERALTAADAVITVAANGSVDVVPPERLAYVPAQSPPEALPADIFAEAEALEFGSSKTFPAAEVAYRRLAQSGVTQVRAEALMRLGRLLRHERKAAESLRAYALLADSSATLAGMPAGLVARAARITVLVESGEAASARKEAAALWGELTAGNWKTTKAALETYLSELRSVSPDLALPPEWEERMTLAAAAEWAFDQKTDAGRGVFRTAGNAATVDWSRQGGVWNGRVTGPARWSSLWAELEHATGTSLRVADAQGDVLNHAGPGGERAFRAAEMTGLPWSVTVSLPGAVSPSRSWTARRRLMVAGLVVFGLLLGAGSFIIVRAMKREFAVLRLQSDFVAAVSHEFRTPLTSIRQLTELLARGRMESEQHRQRAYELMLGESDRLWRLVESLLDFGRMQAHQYTFRSEEIEAAQWTRTVAEQFQETVRPRGYVIEYASETQDARLSGDREALGGALWNLLDNAVKYSPEQKQVRVQVSCTHNNLEVSVRDHGSGIAKEDLKRVFRKFYRGANALQQGTKGTGIGLAIVKEIVEAHGGSVRVRSDPGRGSEFTMVIPCRAS
jgi:signal transduction histidine kinase